MLDTSFWYESWGSFHWIEMYVKDRNLLFFTSYKQLDLFIGTFCQKYLQTDLLTPDRIKWSENPNLSVFLHLENMTDGCKCCWCNIIWPSLEDFRNKTVGWEWYREIYLLSLKLLLRSTQSSCSPFKIMSLLHDKVFLFPFFSLPPVAFWTAVLVTLEGMKIETGTLQFIFVLWTVLSCGYKSRSI